MRQAAWQFFFAVLFLLVAGCVVASLEARRLSVEAIASLLSALGTIAAVFVALQVAGAQNRLQLRRARERDLVFVTALRATAGDAHMMLENIGEQIPRMASREEVMLWANPASLVAMERSLGSFQLQAAPNARIVQAALGVMKAMHEARLHVEASLERTGIHFISIETEIDLAQECLDDLDDEIEKLQLAVSDA